MTVVEEQRTISAVSKVQTEGLDRICRPNERRYSVCRTMGGDVPTSGNEEEIESLNR